MPDILNLNDLYRSKIDTRQRLDYSPGATKKSSLYGVTPAQKIQLIEQQKAIEEYQKSLQEPKDGGFFESKYAVEKQIYFDSFSQALIEIEMVSGAREEAKKELDKTGD